MESYMRELKRTVEERRAKRAAAAPGIPADPLADLRARITTWYTNLAPEQRLPYWHMDELVGLFKTTPQYLGVALDALGWTRRRTWTKGRPYRNRWQPPQLDPQ